MLRYQVADMTCGHCVRSITAAIQGADPAATVDVDLANKTVNVSRANSAEAVEGAIREAGYTPVAASAEGSETAPGGSCCGHC